MEAATSAAALCGRWQWARARRSEVPERSDEKQKRQEGRYQAVNAESVDKGELNVHEVHRKGRADSGIEKRAQTQSARKRIEREQCCESKHAQIIENAEISERYA